MSLSEYDYLCDFSNVMKIVIKYINHDDYSRQVNLYRDLFKTYLKEETEGGDKLSSYFNPSSEFNEIRINKYINGSERINIKIKKYYDKNKDKLADDIEKRILTIMYDSLAAVNEIYSLVQHDFSI